LKLEDSFPSTFLVTPVESSVFYASIFIASTSAVQFRNLKLQIASFAQSQSKRLLLFSVRFLCQASSLDFLSKQNFDFNKLFKEGISYLKSDDENKLKAILLEKREQRRQSNQVQNRLFAERSSTKERTHHPTPPKFGNKCKHLRECARGVIFFTIYTVCACNFTFFTIL
jgi:hypothetical protein